jgi:peptide deformylase
MSKILIYPNPILKKLAQKIVDFDENLQLLSEDLLRTMVENDGIGLAAPQIGVLQRIFVMNLRDDSENYPSVFVNPEIKEASGSITYEEGCLSIPNIRSEIERKKDIQVSYQDLKGVKRHLKATDLAAICIQHEIDHLNGVLFLDYLSPLKKRFLLKKYNKLL